MMLVTNALGCYPRKRFYSIGQIHKVTLRISGKNIILFLVILTVMMSVTFLFDMLNVSVLSVQVLNDAGDKCYPQKRFYSIGLINNALKCDSQNK